MTDAEAITKGEYFIYYQNLKNILGEVEGHKCANRCRNILRVEYEVLTESNVNLEANLSIYLSLQAKKKTQTFI